MLEKILAQLVKKFPGVSKQFLGLWAAKLVSKVTEEAQIQGVVDELDNLPVPIADLATEYQKEGDRRVTTAEKEWKKKNPSPAPEKDKDDTPVNDDTPPWAKLLMQEFQALKSEKTQTSIRAKVAEKLKDKVPEKFYSKWAVPEKEEDLDSFIESIEKEWTDFKQEQVNAGLMSATPPAGKGGQGSGSGSDANIEADMKKWADKTKSKPENKVATQTT